MSLIERLAQKLDVEAAEAEDLLDEYLRHTKRSLEENGTVHLTGIGEFRQTDRELVFTPDTALEELANHRYAGLRTVEVTSDGEPSSPDPIGDPENEPEPYDTEEIADETDNVYPLPRFQEEPEEDAGENERDELKQFWGTEETDSPLGPLPTDTYTEPSYSVVDEGTKEDEGETAPTGESIDASGQTADESREAPADDASSPPPENPAGEPAKDAAKRRRTPPGRRGSDTGSRRQLGLLAAVLIASGSLLLVYFLWSGAGSPPVESSSNTPPPAENAPSVPAVEEEKAAEEQTSSDSEQPPESQESSPEAETASPFESPLRSSDGIAVEHGGYTWVVASMADRERAENLTEEFQNNGFRTSILEGGSGFRVAVGQFETIEQVQATREELPSDVASDAWVLNIAANL